MRLIDADALKFKNVAEVNGYLTHILTAEEINNALTVEPFEIIGAICNENCGIYRPRGEWLHPYKINIACECSNCRMQMPITDYFNFCPNCGADMRKGGAE